jgi:hypothetical protein
MGRGLETPTAGSKPVSPFSWMVLAPRWSARARLYGSHPEEALLYYRSYPIGESSLDDWERKLRDDTLRRDAEGTATKLNRTAQTRQSTAHTHMVRHHTFSNAFLKIGCIVKALFHGAYPTVPYNEFPISSYPQFLDTTSSCVVPSCCGARGGHRARRIFPDAGTQENSASLEIARSLLRDVERVENRTIGTSDDARDASLKIARPNGFRRKACPTYRGELRDDDEGKPSIAQRR